MSNPNRQFININNPDDVRSRKYVWNVRSHASRSSRSPARISRAENQERRSRAARAPRAPRSGGEDEGSASDYTEPATSPISPEPVSALASPSGSSRAPRQSRADTTSPAHPALPETLMALIDSLSKASPYLTGPGEQSTETRHPWPEWVDEPALYLSQLLSAVELINHTYQRPLIDRVALLSLRVSSLRAINDVLGDSEPANRDATLASVAQMTLHEFEYGDYETYSKHMFGLKRMIALRGGLEEGVASPFLNQALRFSLSIEQFKNPDASGAVGDSSRRPPCQRHCQLAISIHAVLLTFLEQPSALPSRWYWLLYNTSRHAMRAMAVAESVVFPGSTGAEEAEAPALLQELLEASRYFQPRGPADAYVPNADTFSIVGECMRLAMISTLHSIIDTPFSASAARDAMASLWQMDSERLLGTQFALVFAWVHYAVNGSREAS